MTQSTPSCRAILIGGAALLAGSPLKVLAQCGGPAIHGMTRSDATGVERSLPPDLLPLRLDCSPPEDTDNEERPFQRSSDHWHPEGAPGGRCCTNRGLTAAPLSPDGLIPRAPALARRRRPPHHMGIKPHCQRTSPPQCLIVSRPVRGLVLRRGPIAHASQLSRWIHAVNPSPDLCNKAAEIRKTSLQIPC